MNGSHPDRELPTLDDDQIRLLDSICKSASRYPEAPFKALTRAYDEQFRKNELDPSRDNAIFRWVMRVGEATRRSYHTNIPTNLIPALRQLLAANNITIIDDPDEEGEVEGITRSLEVHPSSARQHPDSERKRRVSFDDARLEETWLSERSQFAHDATESVARDSSKQPPRRPGMFAPRDQRPRSVSGSEHHFGGPHPAPKDFQHPSHSSDYTSDYDEEQNSDVIAEFPEKQLKLNALAFRDLVLIKYLRQCLQILRNTLVQREEDYDTAAAHDRHHLLKPSFEGLLINAHLKRQQREDDEQEENRINHLSQVLADCESRRNVDRVHLAFSHWLNSTRYHRRATQAVKREVLARKYFRRWRDIAAENIVKSRSILTRKFLRIWQLRTTRKALDDEMLVARYEEFLARKYLRKWRLQCRSRRAEPWHDFVVERTTLVTLHLEIQHRHECEEQAAQYHVGCRARYAIRHLWKVFSSRREAGQHAEQHHVQQAAFRCMRTLSIEAKLKPAASALSIRLELNLKRKVFNVWHLHLQLHRQAAEVDRKRVLQSAWTNWNDALRCKALGQRIDERVLRNSLSRWILQTRLQTCRRSHDQRLLHRTISTWREKARRTITTIDEAEIAFAESQRRRRLQYGMLRLHMSMRGREDAVRAAVEFSNSRALPDVIDVWRQRTDHVRQLSAWAKDARFYVLCTRSLKIWRERTTEHQHQRRRQAYAHVRARVKVRIVRDCFARLRTRSTELSSLKQDAENRSQARLFRVGTQGFHDWRRKTAQQIEHYLQAQTIDRQKLLTSAFSALFSYYAATSALEQQALLSRRESDLALQASALRKAQWANFTATRRIESADALRARNLDMHMKQMLRHWALQAVSRKVSRSNARQEDAESPSLRPASRLATRSAERPTFVSSPPVQSATPGYLRTPSRSRRGGRFRPLPTPAHVTPMAFDRSYLVTTPAPLTNAGADLGNDAEANGVFDGLTPQITPFARKLRAGGVANIPPSALRSSIFGRSVAGGTNKSVRFAGSSRFGSRQRKVLSTDE